MCIRDRYTIKVRCIPKLRKLNYPNASLDLKHSRKNSYEENPKEPNSTNHSEDLIYGLEKRIHSEDKSAESKDLDEYKEKIGKKFERSATNKAYKFPRSGESDEGNSVAKSDKPLTVSIYDNLDIRKEAVTLRMKKPKSITPMPIRSPVFYNQYVKVKKMNLRSPLHGAKILSSLNPEALNKTLLLRVNCKSCTRSANPYEDPTVFPLPYKVTRSKYFFKNKARVASNLNRYKEKANNTYLPENIGAQNFVVAITPKHTKLSSMLIKGPIIRQTVEEKHSTERSMHFKAALKNSTYANSCLEHYAPRESQKGRRQCSRYMRCKICI
eukprot:TRINITY_DN2118_c0_g2_i1.p1 TRINITY_DN2118_c0_g2~~TRINITY_DN2118_c0_g2_i1.p1  ORF type:complete len:326 (+),score=32.70 TRINITY_DN2118_c0_g2_i1:73-1050(+)